MNGNEINKNGKDKFTFESAQERLSEIVKILESGNAGLDESLSLFEEGVKLIKTCNMMLDEAEQKVKILIDCDGETTESDFSDTEA